MAGSKRTRAQQTRIAFTPLPSSSPAANDYHQQIKDRAAAVRYESGSPSPAKRRKVQFSSPNNDTGRYMPTPDTPVEASSSRNQRRSKPRQQRLDLAALSSARSSQQAVDQAAPHKDRTTLEDDSSNESDEMPVKSAKKRRSAARSFMSSSHAIRTRGQTRLDLEPVSNPIANHTPPASRAQILSDDSEEDDEDDMPTTIGSRKRGSQRSQVAPPSSPPFDEPSEDDLEVIQVRPSKANMDDSEDDARPVTPHRRKLKRAKVLSQQDRSDLAEDLEFLEPSGDEDTPRQPRTGQNERKTARMNALDALKRKRSGKAAEPEQEPAEEETSEVEGQYVSSESEGDTVPTSSRAMFQANEEDDDFLVEDDEGALGVPENVPIEFSKYATMKPKELFQYAVEWMVQKKINPAFSFDDSLYDLTFKKLNDEVSGLVSSKFSSSAWTSDFTISLRSRPTIQVTELERLGVDDMMQNHCDACNRTNHPASMSIQFMGKPYYVDTLEDVEVKDDDDDDNDELDSQELDDSDTEKTDYDAQGREVPPSSRIYHVGRFCGANAETAHELAHWKLSLYDWVVEWIDENGYNTPEKLVERDRWSNKKRRKYANKLADTMLQTGVTKDLWKGFENSITRARDAKQGRY